MQKSMFTPLVLDIERRSIMSDQVFESIDTGTLAEVCGGFSRQLFGAMQHAIDMGLTIHSTTTGHHAKHSRHTDGRAFDVYGTERQMQAFVKWARTTHPHELIHRNLFLKDGHRVRGIGGHNGHVHYSV